MVSMGRPLTRTYPDGGVEKYAYSAAGVTLYTNLLTGEMAHATRSGWLPRWSADQTRVTWTDMTTLRTFELWEDPRLD